MSFSSIYAAGKTLSFEFFPPRSPDKLDNTIEIIDELSEYTPGLMTVTYGAGGGTRDLTSKMVHHIHHTLHLPAVAHLTCVGHSKQEIFDILRDYDRQGLHNILALRGDPPKGESRFVPHPEGFGCARDLVRYIKEHFSHFSIAVAGYPESHQEATSADADLKYLKEKVDAGADIVFTQLFFDNAFYFNFAERARAIGISVPLIPGIMPIGNVKQVRKFTTMCGASIPASLANTLQQYEDDQESVTAFGIEYAKRQCEDLLSQCAPGIHLYTLNRCTQVGPLVKDLHTYFMKDDLVCARP